MSGFLDGYEPVADRIERFYSEHRSEGSIMTEIVEKSDQHVLVKATIILAGVARATGFAQEHVTQRGVNSTSALENCETSAIGRALANFGYSAKAGPRPSREEMAKTQGPPRATDDQVAAIEAAMDQLDDAERAELKQWWKIRQYLPLRGARRLLAQDVDAVLAEIGRMIDERAAAEAPFVEAEAETEAVEVVA